MGTGNRLIGFSWLIHLLPDAAMRTGAKNVSLQEKMDRTPLTLPRNINEAITEI